MVSKELEIKASLDAIVERCEYLNDIADGDTFGYIGNKNVEKEIRIISATVLALAERVLKLVEGSEDSIDSEE